MEAPDRHVIKQRLRHTQERLAAVVQMATDAIIVVDEQQRILLFNAAAMRMFGCPQQEAIGTHLERFVPPRFRARHAEGFERVRQTEVDRRSFGLLPTLCGLRATGEEFPCEASIAQHQVGGQREFTVIIRDITERQRSEEALRRRVEFESFLFELSGTFIGLPEDMVDAHMERGLARVGAFLEMDRLTLLELTRDRAEMSVVHSWSAPGVASATPTLTKQMQPWWLGQVLRGDVSLASRVDDLPEEAVAEREYLRQRGVASAASIPLRVGGEIAGAMSFITVHRYVSWTPELVNQLRAIGDIFWNALKRRQAMHALLAARNTARESEERFRLIANAAPVMIWMSGADAATTYVNQQWLEFTGQPASAAWVNDSWEGIHPDDRVRYAQARTEAFNGRQPFQLEYRLCRRDGIYRWVLESGVPILSQDGMFEGFVGSAIDVTTQTLAKDALSTLSRRLMEAQEQERARIARELHDDLAQRAVTLAMELHDVGHLLPPGTREHVRLQQVCEQTTDLARDIQVVAQSLHSGKLEILGLSSAASGLCRDLAARYRVEITFTAENLPKNLARDVALCVFRVLQEALTNALKHAGVPQVSVVLRGTPTEILLDVIDRGVGFDPETMPQNGGLGLLSMKERLMLVNGEILVASRPGAGTAVHVRVPIESQDTDVSQSPMLA
jgi:PAS domain S-box-containing protein